VALGACWAWPEARNRPRAAGVEAELTARRAAPVLGFSALLAFHARQCAVTPLFAAGAAPQALKKRPAPTARTCTEKCELAAGRWPLATGYLAAAAAAAAAAATAIAVAALGATFAAALAAASAAAALS